MHVSSLSDQELVSAIERHTAFQFRGMAWCVQANCTKSRVPATSPEESAFGVTYWGDAIAATSQNPDMLALTALEAISRARENMKQDGIVHVSGMAVFTGRHALQRIHAALLEPGVAAVLRHRNSKGSRSDT